MPVFCALSGWWTSDARVHRPTGYCRHGAWKPDEVHACREAMRKGPTYWLRPHKRTPLPPQFRLPYSGGWTPQAGADAWERSPIPATMRRAYTAMTASERTEYLLDASERQERIA